MPCATPHTCAHPHACKTCQKPKGHRSSVMVGLGCFTSACAQPRLRGSAFCVLHQHRTVVTEAVVAPGAASVLAPAPIRAAECGLCGKSIVAWTSGPQAHARCIAATL